MEDLGVIIDRIIDSLSDGGWKEVDALSGVTGLDVKRMGVILDFLVRFEFVDMDGGRVRLTNSMMKLVSPNIDDLQATATTVRKVPGRLNDP